MTGYDSEASLNELFKNLDTLGPKTEKKLFRKGMKLIADKLVQQSKMLAPAKTGKLRDSIASRVSLRKNKGGVVATIGSGLFYARFVELGFMHAGKPTRHVPARPFLTPVMESSFDTNGRELKEFLASEVMVQMAKASKRR